MKHLCIGALVIAVFGTSLVLAQNISLSRDQRPLPNAQHLNVVGAPSIAQHWSGLKNLTAANVDATAASAISAEAAAIIRMTSATGSASGSAPESAYKIALGIENTMNPGSGNGYGMNSVLHVNKGVGYQTAYGIEIDLDNYNMDYPLPSRGGTRFANGLTITGYAHHPATSAIYIDSANTKRGQYQFHSGLYFFSPQTIKDYTFRDEAAGATSVSIAGSHTVALATWEAATEFALQAAEGQRVCFNVTSSTASNCLRHNGKSLDYEVAGVTKFSISDTGVASAAVFRQATVTVAGLTKADPSPQVGDRQIVTDAASCTFGSVIKGGGSVHCPVVYLNGAWKAG